MKKEYTFSALDDFFFPEEESPTARFSLEDGGVTLSFSRFSTPVSPDAVRDPLLRRMSRDLRRDGTMPLKKALDWYQRYQLGNLPRDLPVEFSPEFEYLEDIGTPEDFSGLSLCFLYDGEENLFCAMANRDQLWSYDGDGIFVSTDGTYFFWDLPVVFTGFWGNTRRLPADRFGLFFRTIAPKLEVLFKEAPAAPSLSFSLSPAEYPPVHFSFSEGKDGKRLVTVVWDAPFRELHYFKSNRNLAEYAGILYPIVPQLQLMPLTLARDGVFSITPALQDFLGDFYRLLPQSFSYPPPKPVTPVPPAPAVPPALTSSLPSTPPLPPEPLRLAPADAAPIPPRSSLTEKEVSLPSPAGTTVRRLRVQRLDPQRVRDLRRFQERYGDFRQVDASGDELPAPPPAALFSVSNPTWSDLQGSRLAAYLYYRVEIKEGRFPDISYSYLYLLLSEIANCPGNLNLLTELYTHYKNIHHRLRSIMPSLLRDYIVLFRPDTPLSVLGPLFSDIPLPYYWGLFYPLDSPDCLRSIPLHYILSFGDYKYKKSRLWEEHAEEMMGLYRKALLAVDSHLRENGEKGLLEARLAGTHTLRFSALTPLVVLPENTCDLVYLFPAVQEDEEFRSLFGDILRYTENAYRASRKISGRMRISRLPADFAGAIDEALAPRPQVPAREAISVDIRSAVLLEEASWETTSALIAAAGGDLPTEEETGKTMEEDPVFSAGLPEEPEEPEEASSAPVMDNAFPEVDSDYGLLLASLTEEELAFLRLVAQGAPEEELVSWCISRKAMPMFFTEAINEKAQEYTGDILLENGSILPDYAEEILPLLEELF